MVALQAIDLLIGCGGFAAGLEEAGFEIVLGVDEDSSAVESARLNHPLWPVKRRDVRTLSSADVVGVDLIAAGLPVPRAGDAQASENETISACVELVAGAHPRAVLFEATSALLRQSHRHLYLGMRRILEKAGYQLDVQILRASSFGLIQARPRVYVIALKSNEFLEFDWPRPVQTTETLGSLLHSDMSERGWGGASEWARRANVNAPTIVGGSRRHGGADLGPTGTKRAWWRAGIDPTSIAVLSPAANDPVALYPRLTIPMVAKIQGLGGWRFAGSRSSQFRIVASATPPSIGEALGGAVREALL